MGVIIQGFGDYFVNIKRIPLDYQDHKKFYDHYKGDKRYYCEINKYINDKSLVFDAKDYVFMCGPNFYRNRIEKNLVATRLSNLEHIYKINNIIKRKKIIQDTYNYENLHPLDNLHNGDIYHNRIVINSVINRRVHWSSYKDNPHKMGEVVFDNSVFYVWGYLNESKESYIVGESFFKECDIYVLFKKLTLAKFHFYKCNFVVTDMSGINFENCIFEKCDFVKNNLSAIHNYELLFDGCRFLEMDSYKKIVIGDIKYFLQRK